MLPHLNKSQQQKKRRHHTNKHTKHHTALVMPRMLIVQVSGVVLESLFPSFVGANLPHLWDDQAEVLREMEGSFLGVATPWCHHSQFLGVTVLSRSSDFKKNYQKFHGLRHDIVLEVHQAYLLPWHVPLFYFPNAWFCSWKGRRLSFEMKKNDRNARYSPLRRSILPPGTRHPPLLLSPLYIWY